MGATASLSASYFEQNPRLLMSELSRLDENGLKDIIKSLDGEKLRLMLARLADAIEVNDKTPCYAQMAEETDANKLMMLGRRQIKEKSLIETLSLSLDQIGGSSSSNLSDNDESSEYCDSNSNNGESNSNDEDNNSDKNSNGDRVAGNYRDDINGGNNLIVNAENGDDSEAVLKDSYLKVAYWRDPVKVKKEQEKGRAPKGVSVLETLSSCDIEIVNFTTRDILNHRLQRESFDALLVPGGFAPNYESELGTNGAKVVRDFVRHGGGYVGLCAGAYLGCKDWLELLPSVFIDDIEHWQRGKSNDCVIKIHQAAAPIFVGAVDSHNQNDQKETVTNDESLLVRYANGPLLAIDKPIDGSEAFLVATFASDYCGKQGSLKKGVMQGNGAIVCGTNGAGRVVLISPHLEDGEPAARRFLRNAVRWVAQQDRKEVAEPLQPRQIRREIREKWLAERTPLYKASEAAVDMNRASAKLLSSERKLLGCRPHLVQRLSTAKRSNQTPDERLAFDSEGQYQKQDQSTESKKLVVSISRKTPWNAAKAEKNAKDKPSDIQFLFVYGSLRPDDNSGQPWTQNFVKGFSFQARGQLKGARMFHDDYASVTLDGKPDELVYGYVLGLPGKSNSEAWKKKLKQADRIEGFDESSPKDSLYKRAVVEVTMLLPKKGSDNKIVMVQEVIKTFIYHRPDCLRHTQIMSGDWLQRMAPKTVKPAHNLGVGPFIIPDELPAPIKKVSKTKPENRKSHLNRNNYEVPALVASLPVAVPQVECLGGPILITAPHGLRLYRGGKVHRERRRIHQREQYTSELALKLSMLIAAKLGTTPSFIVWNMRSARKLDPKNRDPNYLLESQFAENPWHQGLRRFQERCAAAKVPSLHIDFHGKRDRKGSKKHILDIGIDPLLECCKNKADTGAKDMKWTHHEAYNLQLALIQHLEKAMAPLSVVSKKVGVEGDPYLCGLWGHDCEHTLSHQSVRLGVPAFQLEAPRSLRAALMKEEDALDRMAEAIINVYQNVVVPVEEEKGLVNNAASLPIGNPYAGALANALLVDIEHLAIRDKDKHLEI